MILKETSNLVQSLGVLFGRLLVLGTFARPKWETDHGRLLLPLVRGPLPLATNVPVTLNVQYLSVGGAGEGSLLLIPKILHDLS